MVYRSITRWSNKKTGKNVPALVNFPNLKYNIIRIRSIFQVRHINEITKSFECWPASGRVHKYVCINIYWSLWFLGYLVYRYHERVVWRSIAHLGLFQFQHKLQKVTRLQLVYCSQWHPERNHDVCAAWVLNTNKQEQYTRAWQAKRMPCFVPPIFWEKPYLETC